MNNNHPTNSDQPQDKHRHFSIPVNRLHRKEEQAGQALNIRYPFSLPKDRNNRPIDPQLQLPITPPQGIRPKPTSNVIVQAQQLISFNTHSDKVQQVSFKLYSGELVCIAGEYNSGANALLSLLALEEKAAGGTLTIHNRDTVSLTCKERHAWQQQHIVSIRHSHIEIAEQKGFDFVAYWLHYYEDVPWEDAKAWARKALQEIKMPYQKGNMAISNLSPYEQVCLSIAKIILPSKHNRTLYLFDDLFKLLDESEAAIVITYLRGLARQDKTVVTLMNHYDAKLASLFDHVLVMQNNNLIEGYNQHP